MWIKWRADLSELKYSLKWTFTNVYLFFKVYLMSLRNWKNCGLLRCWKILFAVEVINNKFLFCVENITQAGTSEISEGNVLKNDKYKCSILRLRVPFIAGFIYFAFLRYCKAMKFLQSGKSNEWFTKNFYCQNAFFHEVMDWTGWIRALTPFDGHGQLGWA